MSVSGTIIGRKIDGSFHFTSKPSLVLSNDLLEQYIGISKGKKPVKLYKCDTTDKCLNPVESEITLSDKETIYGNVSRILEGLVPKVKENKAQLTDEEEDVIAFSSIPLLQIIEMELAEKSETSEMMVRMSEFIEVVCYDVMTNFLSQMINQASASVQSLEYAQLDDAVIKKFTGQVAEVRSFLTSANFSAFKRLQVITQVKERLQQQQRAFRAHYFRFAQQAKQT